MARKPARAAASMRAKSGRSGHRKPRLAEKRSMIISSCPGRSWRPKRHQRLLIEIDSTEIAALERQAQGLLRPRRKCGYARIDFRADIETIDRERRHHRTRGFAAADG